MPLKTLLAAMREKRQWARVTEAQIREVVESSDKQRFEIREDQIRARYGHSVEEPITYPEVEPPEFLYHGTSPAVLAAIRREGLRPMRRQHVHHATYVELAQSVGRRHSPNPIVLTVRAKAAWAAGIRFYQPETRLYLSGPVPPEFLVEDILS